MGKKAVLHLLGYIFAIFTVLLAGLAVLCWHASYVSPLEGGIWALLAFGLPAVLIINFIVMIWCLVRRRWFVALFPAAAIVFNVDYISASVQLPDFKGRSEESYGGAGVLRVGTLNVNGFRSNGSVSATAHDISVLMYREEVDIMCIQEFVADRNFSTEDIAALFSGRMPYYVREESSVILSRYPILGHENQSFSDAYYNSNDFLRVDLLIGRDTVRVFSVHLQTSGVAFHRRRFRKEYNREMPVDSLINRWELNTKKRVDQVHLIRDKINQSPYPVILAGDFNDTPSTYTYHTIKGGLVDGFSEAGHGFGSTFRYMGGGLRIDYIFHDKSYTCERYTILNEKISDHKAVVSVLKKQ